MLKSPWSIVWKTNNGSITLCYQPETSMNQPADFIPIMYFLLQNMNSVWSWNGYSSTCCLSPAVSENITVRRIVDRYLEHARIFIFHNNGEPEYFMGSADWMNRNLYSRIEVCFPVYNKNLCNEIDHIIQLQLADNKKAVLLNEDLENIRVKASGHQTAVAAQESIYNYVKTSAIQLEHKETH